MSFVLREKDQIRSVPWSDAVFSNARSFGAVYGDHTLNAQSKRRRIALLRQLDGLAR